MKKIITCITLLFLASSIQQLNAMAPSPDQKALDAAIAQTMEEPWFQLLREKLSSGERIAQSIQLAFEEYKQTSPLRDNPEAMRSIELIFLMEGFRLACGLPRPAQENTQQ